MLHTIYKLIGKIDTCETGKYYYTSELINDKYLLLELTFEAEKVILYNSSLFVDQFEIQNLFVPIMSYISLGEMLVFFQQFGLTLDITGIVSMPHANEFVNMLIVKKSLFK